MPCCSQLQEFLQHKVGLIVGRCTSNIAPPLNEKDGIPREQLSGTGGSIRLGGNLPAPQARTRCGSLQLSTACPSIAQRGCVGNVLCLSSSGATGLACVLDMHIA